MNPPPNMVLKCLALYAAVVTILFFRLPDAFTHANFFAEDGYIFFKQQYELGFCKALCTHYAGYLHFIPRIVAGVCSVFPLLWQPLAYSAASLLIAAFALTLFVLPCFRRVIASDILRGVIVLVFTLMPNHDSLMKLAYVNFYMAFILVLIVLAELPANRLGLMLVFAMASLAAWTTPVGIACLPVAVLRIFTTKQKSQRIWWGLLSVAIFGYFLTAEKESGTLRQLLHKSDGIESLVKAVSYKVFCFFTIGRHFCSPRYLETWTKEAVIAAITVTFCLIALIRVRRPVLWPLAYLIIGTSSLFVLRPTSWSVFVRLDELCWSGSERYFLCGTLLLCIFWGVVYEKSFHEWVLKSPSRRNLCILALLAWLNLHELSFREWQWQSEVSWGTTCKNITEAKRCALTSGVKQTVPVEVTPRFMDFALAVNP